MFSSKYELNLKNKQLITNITQLKTDLDNNRELGDMSFHNPFLFSQMEKVVNRIKKAINNQELIYIYGDYDADGINGTYIIYKTIEELGGKVKCYIPNRFTDGYGPNLDVYKRLVSEGAKLIITVDNGIKSNGCDSYLKKVDVDLIITDHHECGEVIPDAFAIIHPLVDDDYPYKYLSGAGVAYKVSCALTNRDMLELIDYAAVGTYADMVDVRGENRLIISEGINKLRSNPSPLFKNIFLSNKVKEINEETIGFIIGPRVNAYGRLKDANELLGMIVNNNIDIKRIEEINQQRKTITQNIIKEAEEIINYKQLHMKSFIILYKPDWHEGVLGIVASNIVNKYKVPVVVLTNDKDNEFVKGSARSIGNINIIDLFIECKELLAKYGGHTMAAGLSLKYENIDLLDDKLNALVNKSDILVTKDVDYLLSGDLVSREVNDLINKYRPFGVNNSQPLFLLEDCKVVNKINRKNVVFIFEVLHDNNRFEVIFFNDINLYNVTNIGDLIDVVGTLKENKYLQNIKIQIQLIDIMCRHMQIYDMRDKEFWVEESSTNLYVTNQLYDFNKLKTAYFKRNWDNIILKSSTFPVNREIYADLYRFLDKYKKVNINSFALKDFIKGKNLTDNDLKTIIKVFFELDFVIIKDDEIVMRENSRKRDLKESPTYNEILKKYDIYKLDRHQILDSIKTGGNI